MKNYIKEEQKFKPTLAKPMSTQSKAFEKNFSKTMTTNKVNLNETDALLSEAEFSLKKKIFSLAKMEALVFSDPKLSAVYGEMSENGENKFGYHYNETIMNMLFNDYVLNSPKYLQKYKQAIPKEKKRRDKSGINQLKRAGEKMQTRNLESKPESTLEENDEEPTKVQFLVNEKDPQDPDLFAYFPEENFDREGVNKTAYSHIGQHSAASPKYAAESRPATPEEYQDLKAELESIGYNLEVINPTNETTGAGSSGAFAPAMGYVKQVDETTSSGSAGGSAGYVGYAGPAAWGSGDLMKTKGKSKVMRKPIWQGGTIIQESNYLIDPIGFEKYVNALNESDVDFIQKNSEAYGSLDKMNGNDINIIKNDIKTGQLDTPNLNTMEEQTQNTGKISTVEELKAYAAEKKAQGVQGFMKEAIPMLAGAALYEVAIRTANRILGNKIGLSWDDLGDTNSMWDYIDQNGGMTYEDFVEGVKNAANDRLDEEGFGGGEMDEVSKSKKQQRFMGMVHAVQKGELSPEKVGGDVEKAAKTMSDKDVEDFASTKHKNLPEKVDEMESGEWEVKQDLRQLQADAMSADTEALRHMGLVGRIVNESNSIDELLSGLGEYFEYKKITDSDLITSIVGKAVNMFKNKNIKEDTQTMIQNNGTSMSNKAIPAGEQSSNMDMGTRASGGMNEAMNVLDTANKLLEEINNELNAFSIHHDKLKKMAEDRKPSALVLRDRVGSENESNFKKDLQHSVTKDVIDIEKELQYKDQQTEVDKDPQKLGQDIEEEEIKTTDAKSGEALKNVGDSANDKGDEIPKRNLKTKEQEEVDMYRLGQHSLVYDNEPGKRFEDRMKADMGDKIYDIREKQLKFRGKAPMYNKDLQPVEDTTSDKVQFNKEQTGWNEREGLKETMITGRFVDALGKKFIMDFRLNEVKVIDDVKKIDGLFELDFTGFGNKYKGKTQDKKVVINEGIDAVLSESKYYTDGKGVIALKNPVQKLNENEQKEVKRPVNEQFDKMKHLLGYKPETFVNTNNVKKNRGF